MARATTASSARPALSAYVAVPDVDALFARATAAGASVVLAPPRRGPRSRSRRSTPTTARDCVLRDSEGGTWAFGTYPGTALPAEASTASAAGASG